MVRKQFSIIFLLFLFIINGFSQNIDYKQNIDDWLYVFEKTQNTNTILKVNDLKIDDKKKTISVTFNGAMARLSFTEEMVDSVRKNVKSAFGAEFKGYDILLFSAGENLENLVLNYYRNRIDKDDSRYPKTNKKPKLFITNTSKDYNFKEGLTNRNIALWASHGYYFEQKLDKWDWQRGRILQTAEDKYTAQIVYNFLLPMLENAGANVLLPRERDFNPNEVIVDMDSTWNERWNTSILEFKGDKTKFSKSKPNGFADKKKFYIDGENPFESGTYTSIETDRKETASVEYVPLIEKAGWYSVSVCYKSLPNGVEDARYTIYHTGGETEFEVNQTMGGGTWVYLGSFYFDSGCNNETGKVVLSNKSRSANHFVVADAVKFGGGIGNIARRSADEKTIAAIPDETKRKKAILPSAVQNSEYQTSGRARFWEGARYYMQWAGMPYSVYSYSYGMNDYTDDYAGRPQWVNYLNYGSVNAPDSVGLKIPIELSFALHSDAGLDYEGIVGTLGIVTTDKGEKEFAGGQSRKSSLDLANIVHSSVIQDIRQIYEPNWTSRGIIDKNYAESRIPQCPSMILELLSHQNFNDMKYGLNPAVQFTVARSIYKGILRFVASQYHSNYSVQPLAPQGFSAILQNSKVHLSWSQTIDSLEVTAKPKGYIVYTSKNGKGFNNGEFTRNTAIVLKIPSDTIFSYKITAVNDGGESFPSEILSVCNTSNSKGNILIINGFTKISAPESFEKDEIRGFVGWLDDAVPYVRDFSFTGKQYDFDTASIWQSNDNPGFGASYGNCDTIAIAGNTFDFPLTHGRAVANAGYSFCSSSMLAVEKGDVKMSDFQIVDLILGKQKSYKLGNNIEFRTFSPEIQQKITQFLQKGKSLFVSGTYLGSDLWNFGNENDKKFAEKVLRYSFVSSYASCNGNACGVFSPVIDFKGSFDFAVKPNSTQYHVENPESIAPKGNNAFTVIRYGENNTSAAVACKNGYKTIVCGFPFEALISENQRNNFMKQVLEFFSK